MPKHILILCDTFAAPAYLPRVVNLCRNIKKNWEIDVVTEKLPDENFTTTDFNLHQMPYYKKMNGIGYYILWLLHFIFNYKDKRLVQYAENEVDMSSVNIIFCSTFNLFPLIAAKKLAKKYNIPLVVDLRDIIEQWGQTNYFTRHLRWNAFDKLARKIIERANILRRNKVLKYAKAITSVSSYHIEKLNRINPNTHLIFNGYDAQLFCNNCTKNEYFDIVYTGRIYNLTFRSPHLLFQAIKELNNEGVISADKVRILWYSDYHNELKQLAKEYEIAQFNHFFDYLPTTQIPALLDRASICLILAQRTTEKGPFGIMTTKFFESIGTQKPILCVESDRACLADEITKSGSGLAATNVEQVKNFIIENYNQWQEKGYTITQIANPQIYTRQYQALQFEEIFNSYATSSN